MRGKRNESVDTGMMGAPERMLELINRNGCQTMEFFIEQGTLLWSFMADPGGRAPWVLSY